MAAERKDGSEETEGSVDDLERIRLVDSVGDIQREWRERYDRALRADARGVGHTKPKPFMSFKEWRGTGVSIY